MMLALKVGGVLMPTTKGAPAGTVHIVDVKDSGSVFYDLINKKFTQVDKTNALNIPLSGKMAAGVIRSDTAAAP